jgi:hypothetical protein
MAPLSTVTGAFKLMGNVTVPRMGDFRTGGLRLRAPAPQQQENGLTQRNRCAAALGLTRRQG